MQRSPIVSGNFETLPPLALRTAFSITTVSVPIVTGAPSDTITAPCKIAQPEPIVTSPAIVALGATYALEWIFGFLPLLETIMARLPRTPRRRFAG